MPNGAADAANATTADAAKRRPWAPAAVRIRVQERRHPCGWLYCRTEAADAEQPERLCWCCSCCFCCSRGGDEAEPGRDFLSGGEGPDADQDPPGRSRKCAHRSDYTLGGTSRPAAEAVALAAAAAADVLAASIVVPLYKQRPRSTSREFHSLGSGG